MAGCALSILSIGHLLWTFCKDKRLNHRPNSLLAWRAAYDFLFCVGIICSQLQFSLPESSAIELEKCLCEQITSNAADNGGSCCFVQHFCQAQAGYLQFFLLGAESYFLVISIDVYFELNSSPFNDGKWRAKYYHSGVALASATTAYVLVFGHDWGPSEHLLQQMCWLKSFGENTRVGKDITTSRGERNGYVYYYYELFGYYLIAIGVWFYTRWKLAGGLDRTRAIRQTRIDDGKRMLVVYLFYLAAQFVLYQAAMLVDPGRHPGASLVARVLFAALLGARGVPDALVWRVVVLRRSRLLRAARSFAKARLPGSSRSGGGGGARKEGLLDGSVSSSVMDSSRTIGGMLAAPSFTATKLSKKLHKYQVSVIHTPGDHIFHWHI
jgi:hypothetical protein